jgi:hypothetical protein
METKLTFEQAINRLDRIFDTEQKLRVEIAKLKTSLDALNKQVVSNDLLKDELKNIISSYLQTTTK